MRIRVLFLIILTLTFAPFSQITIAQTKEDKDKAIERIKELGGEIKYDSDSQNPGVAINLERK
jgi:hypothetical protein